MKPSAPIENPLRILLDDIPVEMGRDLIYERLAMGSTPVQHAALKDYLSNPENNNPVFYRDTIAYIFEYLDNEGLCATSPTDYYFLMLCTGTLLAICSLITLFAVTG